MLSVAPTDLSSISISPHTRTLFKNEYFQYLAMSPVEVPFDPPFQLTSTIFFLKLLEKWA